jgi:hypothetical protein
VELTRTIFGSGDSKSLGENKRGFDGRRLRHELMLKFGIVVPRLYLLAKLLRPDICGKGGGD